MSELANVWGDPIEYKGLKIYPVKLKDCTEFYKNVTCLLYEKNNSPDINIIKMSYLRFLFLIALNVKDENGKGFEFVLQQLEDLLELVTQQEIRFFIDDRIEIQVGDIKISESDFEVVRNIICKQNLIRLGDTIADPELEKAIQEAKEFIAKKSGSNATLEEQIVAYHCVSKIPYQDIKEYTIFQFNKSLERFQIIKNYEVFSSLLVENGKSKEIKHWLAHIEEKGIYDDVTISKEELEQITSDSGIFAK